MEKQHDQSILIMGTTATASQEYANHLNRNTNCGSVTFSCLREPIAGKNNFVEKYSLLHS